jgi:uncharacterized protein
VRLSSYVLAFPCRERAGQWLLFSTRRCSLVRVSHGAWEGLRRGDAPPGAREDLRRAGVLVADTDEERRQVWEYLGEVNRSDAGVTAAVFLGLACNFACPYCYERPLGRAGAMNAGTADRVCAFLLSRLAAGKKRLTVDFYGGEPLLYGPVLRRIAAALRADAGKRGVCFRFSLVTNGSLLTRRVVEELLPLGLAAAKVTLDGPPEVHDRFRPLRSGRGSFRAVLGNLREVAGLVPLGISGNYTRESWRELSRLLDLLLAAGLGPDRVCQVRFGPVVGTAACGGYVSSAEPWVAEAAATLRDAALLRGYGVPRLAPSPCMADLEDAVAIHWDGGLYRCPALVGCPGFRAGSVWSGLEDGAGAYGGARWRDREPCRACAYLPLCFGGCRYLALQRTGTPAALDCQKSYLDAVLPALVAQEARRGKTQVPHLFSGRVQGAL